MSKPDNYYESSPQKHALEDLKRCRCLKWGNKNFSCLNPPDHIILDELYRLLLRVTDVLTLNLLDEMIEWDDEEAHKNKVSNPKAIAQHLQEAVQTINKCGITFPVWEKKNARVPIPTTGPVWWKMKKKKKKNCHQGPSLDTFLLFWEKTQLELRRKYGRYEYYSFKYKNV